MRWGGGAPRSRKHCRQQTAGWVCGPHLCRRQGRKRAAAAPAPRRSHSGAGTPGRPRRPRQGQEPPEGRRRQRIHQTHMRTYDTHGGGCHHGARPSCMGGGMRPRPKPQQRASKTSAREPQAAAPTLPHTWPRADGTDPHGMEAGGAAVRAARGPYLAALAPLCSVRVQGLPHERQPGVHRCCAHTARTRTHTRTQRSSQRTHPPRRTA